MISIHEDTLTDLFDNLGATLAQACLDNPGADPKHVVGELMTQCGMAFGYHLHMQGQSSTSAAKVIAAEKAKKLQNMRNACTGLVAGLTKNPVMREAVEQVLHRFNANEYGETTEWHQPIMLRALLELSSKEAASVKALNVEPSPESHANRQIEALAKLREKENRKDPEKVAEYVNPDRRKKPAKIKK